MTVHGALEAEFPPGAMVAYVTDAYSHPEYGLVVRANDRVVFVRFSRTTQSNPLTPESLRVLIDPIPDPRIQMIEDLIDSYAEERKVDPGISQFIDALTDVLVGAVDSSSEEES